MKSIFIIDQDLGFVVSQSNALYEAGHQAIPATSSSDALAKLAEIMVPIDLVIVNPAVAGVDNLIPILRSQQKPMHIIAALEHPRALSITRFEPDAYWQKPSIPDERAKMEWLELIQNVLAGDSVNH